MITDVVVTPGEIEVVSLELAKQHLRVEPTFVEEDDLITSYIAASVAYCENFIGGFISGTATIKMDDLPLRTKLPIYPINAITSVSYFPTVGTDAEILPNTSYTKMSVDKSSYLTLTVDALNVATRLDATTIVVSIGFEVIPKPIIQAVLLLIGDMYERREDRGEVISTAADKLLRAYKLY